MGSINNELKMSCVSLNHQQFTLIWRLIAGCKLPTALAMNMISILIFPQKTLINTFYIISEFISTRSNAFPRVNVTVSRTESNKGYCVISLNFEQKTSYDQIDVLLSFPERPNSLIKMEAEGAIWANRAPVVSLQSIVLFQCLIVGCY